MDDKELELFRKAYDKSVKKCIKGKDKNGRDIEEQSNWVWFDRAVIEELLAMTDPQSGGIKMYFGQYDENNIGMLPEDRKYREEYIGRISLALAASNKTEVGFEDIALPDTNKEEGLFPSRSGGGIENGGSLCPPDCKPQDN